MDVLEKIVLGGEIMGCLTPIFGANLAMWGTMFAVDDIARIYKKTKPSNFKEKVKCVYKIANTIDVRDLFGRHSLELYSEESLKKYPELGIAMHNKPFGYEQKVSPCGRI